MSLSKYIIWTAIIAVLFLTSCSTEQWRQSSGAAWGTTYHITYKGDKDLADSVIAEMRKVELSMSLFDKNSTLSKINARQSDSVDAMFAKVFNVAKHVYRLSNGNFDPTIAPLTNLWGFGHKKIETTPDSTAISEALKSVGFGQCNIAGGKIIRKRETTEFDFAAIAKGFGVDCVAQMLQRNGASEYMVEIGGEVVTSGNNPNNKPWRIQIDAPTSDAIGDSALRIITLSNRAVATSGNYRNYRQFADGTQYGHTLSPKTGYPVKTSTLSATVIAPTCILADALATACMVMPADSAVAMITNLQETSVLIVVATDKHYKIITAGTGF